MRKTILITGTSSGIGHAAAKLFASRGWQVVATMRDTSAAGDLASQPNVLVLSLDVTDQASIDAAVDRTIATFGGIDVLVNNAGFGAFGPFETASKALIDRQIATNLTGVFNVTRAVLPTMRAQKRGVIINVASIGGLVTLPLNAIYHATKYAVVGFTEGLVYELAPLGIRSKVIAPGGVATDFAGRSLSLTFEGNSHPYADAVATVTSAFQSRRGGHSEPEAIAEAIHTAATDGSSQIKYIAGADAQAMLDERARFDDEDYVREVGRRFGLSL